MSQSTLPALSIVHYFTNLTDPRLRRCRRHNFLDIIVIAICGIICGCKSWNEIAIYGRKKKDWLQTFLELPNGIPGPDTFRRLFARIKPAAFQACFRSWMDALATTLGVKQIAIAMAKRCGGRMTGAWGNRPCTSSVPGRRPTT